MPAQKNNPRTHKFPCLVLKQGNYTLACFVASAKTIWSFVQVNQRDSDKDTGYQRALSQSRSNSITKYINDGNTVPNSILIALDEGAILTPSEDFITIPNKEDAGWVIDGQHRLVGAHQSKKDIQFAVLAFIGLDLEEQIKQFITINREAKGVPTSLYFDLLKHLPPNKSEADMAKERAADIASTLKKDEESPFYQKIVVSPPKSGELSLTNFVRKIAPLVTDKKGFFHTYALQDQIRIIDNYFRALKVVFPEYFQTSRQVFFKTLGFGAMINVITTVFSLSLKEHNGFRVEDVAKVLKKVEDFDFSIWEKSGTGVQAENMAGEDFRQTLTLRFQEFGADNSTIRL